MKLIDKMALGVLETALQNQVFMLDNQRILVKSLALMSDGSPASKEILYREGEMLLHFEKTVKDMKRIFHEEVKEAQAKG